jgi:hypothetical protein
LYVVLLFAYKMHSVIDKFFNKFQFDIMT